MNKVLLIFSVPAVLGLLTGCGLHQIDPHPAPLRNGGSAYSVAGIQAGALEEAWYESFRSPELTALIQTALQNSMDIKQALARFDQAQAVTRGSRAGLFPAIGLEANTAAAWEEGQSQEGISRVGAALTWEIDAFDRLGAAVTAREFEERAAAADVEAVRLTLSAEVAQAWFGAVAQQLQIALLRQQTDGDNELLDLIKKRLDAGIGTNVEVLQQQSQLAENQSLIPPAEAALRVFENRLDVLTGTTPDAVNRTSSDTSYVEISTLPPLGVPSDLLLNRPDIRAMRDRLIAADAQIGTAIADRLPRITLTGSHIYADGPTGAAGYATSLLAGLVQPLLDWGRRQAEVERNQALYEERLGAFTQLYLEAIEDVENALYQENRQREYIDRLETRRNILSQTLAAAQAVYRQGESDYLPVLDSVQDLRGVERDLINQRLNLILFRIQLFRALGTPVFTPVESPQEEPL